MFLTEKNIRIFSNFVYFLSADNCLYYNAYNSNTFLFIVSFKLLTLYAYNLIGLMQDLSFKIFAYILSYSDVYSMKQRIGKIRKDNWVGNNLDYLLLFLNTEILGIRFKIG